MSYNYLTSSIREKIDSNDPVAIKALKKVFNFSEDAVCVFGTKYSVIVSKDKYSLTLENGYPMSSTAFKVLRFVCTVLVVPIVACAAIKLLHRITLGLEFRQIKSPVYPSSSSKPVHPFIASNNIPGVKFGSTAFTLVSKKGNPNPIYSDKQILEILAIYKPKFDATVKATINAGKKISELITLSYRNEISHIYPRYISPYYCAFYKESLNTILEAIGPNSKLPPAYKTNIAYRLADYYNECQDEVIRGLQTLSSEILGQGNIAESVRIMWQKYKAQKLSQFVDDRHPECQEQPTMNNMSHQHPHVKSAYLVLIGNECALDGAKEAAQDHHRPSNILKLGENKQMVIDKFKSKLDIREFAYHILLDINNPNVEVSYILKDLVFKYANGQKLTGFGFYNEEKDYKGLSKPSEDQEFQIKPYISLEESMTLLRCIGICE